MTSPSEHANEMPVEPTGAPIAQPTGTAAIRTPGAVQPSFDKPMRIFWSRASTKFFTVLLFVIVAICFIGPFFTGNPNALVGETLQGPSSEHWLGTDNLGRDLFNRMLIGGQVSILVGVAVAVLCLTIAVFVGGLAGFYGGVADTILMKVSEFFQVIPGIVFALVAAALLGANVTMIVIILALTMWPQVARIIRAECLKIREFGFVESAQAVGFRPIRIFWSDVLPNAFPPVVVATTMLVARGILAESGLAFLGIGDANFPSWGALLNTAQAFMQSAWWLMLFPGLAIFLIVLAINILGDNLNDAYNPTIGKVK